MVNSRAPPIRTWDDDDYGQKHAIFCGKRRLPSSYIHISKVNIERMFAVNPDPEVPVHGRLAARYNDYIDENTMFGPEDGLYFTQDPQLMDDPTPHGKTMAQLKKEAFKLCLVITREDDNFLHAVAKNILVHRLRWPCIGMADFVVKEAFGIDVSHPHYDRCKYSVTKNRDTWQNRVLDIAFDVAARIYTSDWGQEKIAAKYKHLSYYIYDQSGNKKRWLVPLELIKDRCFKLEIAEKVWKPCAEAVEFGSLSKSNGKPTALGKALMFKTMALIQFEMVYLIAKWTNKVTGAFVKQSNHSHARDLQDYFSYLPILDEKYLFKVDIEGTGPDGQATSFAVAHLFPMDRNKTYGKSRVRRKHYDDFEVENDFVMGDLNDDSD